MALAIATSINGVPIRLTDERWRHIVTNRDELASYYEELLDAVEAPELVVRGQSGALIALKGFGRGRYLAVVYKEVTSRDGFVITAYTTRKVNRRAIIWRKE